MTLKKQYDIGEMPKTKIRELESYLEFLFGNTTYSTESDTDGTTRRTYWDFLDSNENHKRIVEEIYFIQERNGRTSCFVKILLYTP